MKKYLFIALALVAGALAFIGCEKSNGKSEQEQTNEQKAVLASGTWVYQVNENGYMFFEFSGNTFKYHEVVSYGGTDIDAWVGGTYTLKGNNLTFTFTDTNVEDMKDELGKCKTEATLDGDQLLYAGFIFKLQK